MSGELLIPQDTHGHLHFGVRILPVYAGWLINAATLHGGISL